MLAWDGHLTQDSEQINQGRASMQEPAMKRPSQDEEHQQNGRDKNSTNQMHQVHRFDALGIKKRRIAPILSASCTLKDPTAQGLQVRAAAL